jgi:predicted DNA-binding transcriptional regulator AlpA
MTIYQLPEGADPRHVFLTMRDLIARYGWGRTKCYEMTRRDDFPRPVGGDRYRLDTLMAWEDAQLGDQHRGSDVDLPSFPSRKRGRRLAS